MALSFDTVAIPVTKGVDLRTSARLVDAPALLRAENVRFDGGGSFKRYGHVSHKALTGTYPPGGGAYDLSAPVLTPYGAKVVDSQWLYGWGIIESETSTGDFSSFPEPGYLFSGFTRDNEKVAWTGHSLISYAPSQTFGRLPSTVAPACTPFLRSEPIAKTADAQTYPDIADNGRVRVVTWINTSDGVATARYSVYDSVTGAQIVDSQVLTTVSPYNPRVFSLGQWFHIVAFSQDDNQLRVYSFSDTNPTDITTRVIGSSTRYWDVWKHDETRACVVWNVDGTKLSMTWVGVLGTLPTNASTVFLAMDSHDDIANVACAVHPVTGRVGVVYYTGPTDVLPDWAVGGVFNHDGTVQGTYREFAGHDSLVGTDALTIAPRYILDLADGIVGEAFDAYFSFEADAATESDELHSWTFNSANEVAGTIIYHQSLASHAFRVGERTFVWTVHKSLLQSTWFLLDYTLKPVGHINFGVAAPIDHAGLGALCSVNFKLLTTLKDQTVYHLGLGVRTRVPTTDDQEGLYTEPSIQYVELDFLHPLRATQAGRTTYMAGAQVWAYDGRELVESGFHIAPEFTVDTTFAIPLSDPGLTPTHIYSYRIDLCYRNAQNEEVRSHSYIVQHTVEAIPGDSPPGTVAGLTLTIKSSITRRDNAYLLIFRNAFIDGAPTSTWNLLNSRDPLSADYLPNDQGDLFITYADYGAVSNTAIIRRELHPGNSQTFLYPFAPPACEVIASGRDRVWLAGGEMIPGEVYPSRLFGVGEAVSWNGNLAIQIDRNEAPITALGFVGDIAAVFRERLTYVQEGDGPDNQGNGFWPPARLALADTGAQNQEGVALCSAGLLFQSPAGFRLLSGSGQVAPIGEAVDSLASTFSVRSCVCISRNSEVRWYGDDLTIVYNYLDDAWSTWTVGGSAALLTPSDSAVTLVKGTGRFWIETPGIYRDGDAPFTHLVQFPWLHAGQLGDFQRLKRIAGLGAYTDPHQVRVEISYDERPYIEEYWVWDVPDTTQNTDSWGAQTWGTGTWGDTGSTFWARDTVWRWRRMPRKQKCSVFSVTISDNNTDGAGFSLVALGLELAKKPGLDRTAVPGGTNVNR